MDIEKKLIGLGYLWLLLAAILFLMGWVTPYISIPLCLILVFCTLKAWWQTSTIQTPKKLQIIQIGLLALLAFGCSFYSGITGHFPQHILDMAQRNAVYGNLVRADWPIILPDGRLFIYYFGAYLTPAFLSKVFGYSTAPYLLLFWNALAFFIAFSLIYLQTQRTWSSWICILLILCLTDPINTLHPLRSLLRDLSGISFNMDGMAGSLLMGCWTTTNHTPGILLITSLLFHKRISHIFLPILGAITVMISVFGAISLLPFFIYKYLCCTNISPTATPFLSGTKTFFSTIEGYCSIILAVIIALYHMCSEGDLLITFSFLVTYGKPFSYILAKTFFKTFLLAGTLIAPIFWVRKKNPLFVGILLCSILAINLIFIGNGGPNELAFKGNTALLIISCFGWIHTLEEGPKHYRNLTWILLSIFVIHTTVTNLAPRIMSYGKKEENINNPFNGHLYHPGTLLDQSVPKSKAALIPGILYNKPGESRQILPFSLLPPEQPGLYNQPASFTPRNSFLKRVPSNSNLQPIRLFTND